MPPTEQPSAAQLAEWERKHPRRDYLNVPALAGKGLDWCVLCRERWPCPFMQVVSALRAAREPRDLERAVVEAALTAVTTWRTMQGGPDQWWDVYVEKRDALIDAVDALLAARGGG